MKTSADLAAHEADTAVKAAQIAHDAARRAEAPARAAEQREQLERLSVAQIAEDWVLRRLSPSRNRWPEIAEHDRRVDEVSQRQSKAAAALNDLRQQLVTAPERDATALAEWQIANNGAPRPEPTVPVLEGRIRELELDVRAADVVRGQLLAEKEKFVDKHRRGLVRDAEQDTQAARAHVHELVDQLEEARAELIECRKAELWSRIYPGESAGHEPGIIRAIAFGLVKPVKQALGLNVQVEANRIFALLRGDADVIAEARTGAQEAALRGVSERNLEVGDSGAMWEGSPEWAEQREQENLAGRKAFAREHGLAAYRREFGGEPPE